MDRIRLIKVAGKEYPVHKVLSIGMEDYKIFPYIRFKSFFFSKKFPFIRYNCNIFPWVTETCLVVEFDNGKKAIEYFTSAGYSSHTYCESRISELHRLHFS